MGTAAAAHEPEAIGPRPGRFASYVARCRWIVLLAWVLLVAVLAHDGVPSFGRDGLTLRELAPADAPELQTELDAARLFRVPLNARVQVVRRDEDGLDRSLQRADIEAAIETSRDVHDGVGAQGPIAFSLPFVNTFGVFPANRESSTTTIVNLVGFPDASLRARERAAHELADAARERGPGRVSVTGGIPAQLETGRIIRASLGTLQLASVLVLVLITAAWFRSVVAPLVVTATIGVTMLVLLEALALVADLFGMQVPAEVLPVVLVVAIGVATDYALFHLAAWHRAVRVGSKLADAAHVAIATTAPVVLAAGLTTALGATSLLLARTGFVAAFAPALVVAVLVALLVGLTLVPALVAISGPHTAWPRRAPGLRRGARRSDRLARRVGTMLRRRDLTIATTACLLVLLGALASQARSAPVGFNIVTGLPQEAEIARGARDAGAGFAPGILSPTLLLVEGRQLDEQTRELASFSIAVDRLPGVAGVLGPDVLRSTIERAGLGEEAAELEHELFGEPVEPDEESPRSTEPTNAANGVEARTARGVLVTRDGQYVRLVVVLDREAYSGAAVADLRALRPQLDAALEEAGVDDATLHVAGDTAIVERVVDQLDGDLLRIAAFLVPLELLVLLYFLRSLTMSLVVVASSLLSTAAAIGILSIHDRTIGPGDGIAFFVPVATFVLLMGIGVDYGVLMGNALRSASASVGQRAGRAAEAISRAAPAIVLAGVVLASTFALLAVVPLGAFRQFAIAMGAGVLVDTLLVRPVLMPLLVTMPWRRTDPGGSKEIP